MESVPNQEKQSMNLEYVERMTNAYRAGKYLADAVQFISDIDMKSLDKEKQEKISRRMENELGEDGSLGEYLKDEDFMNKLRRFGSKANESQMTIENIVKGIL